MADEYELSKGSLKLIMFGVQIEQPIMRVLASQQIPSTRSDKIHCRLLLSDGKDTVSLAMLTTQLNDEIKNKLTDNSIVLIKQYVIRAINNGTEANDRKVLIILGMDILATGNGTTKPSNPYSSGVSPKKQIYSFTSSPTYNDDTMNTTMDTSMQDDITAISDLTKDMNKWVIKAKVYDKSDIYNWCNNNGTGMLFTMILKDESGEIKATVFTEHIQKFYNSIEIDKIYYISNCYLKLSNKRFNNLKHRFEMNFTNDTVVEECQDATIDLPQMRYDFISIDEIKHAEVDTFIDVIGICTNTSDLQTFSSRSSEKDHKKLEVTIIDESNYQITLTIWGKRAEDFDGSTQPVIVIKGAKVGEYGGEKHISVVFSSTMKINPDIPEVHRLRNWFHSSGAQNNSTNVNVQQCDSV